MRIGILTSGGDCSGLNAVIRGFAKYVFGKDNNTELLGFIDGYAGLMNKNYVTLKETDVENILDKGGTILGTSRQPYKLMTVTDGKTPSKLQTMVDNYKKLKLDCIVTLGGAGTHKTAALLSVEGCNVIGLPKTIDNDIYGTDVTFGFHTAVQIATDSINRVQTTADSHSRVIFVEVMGNKVGWLTLYSGIASGADAILIPEIPYDGDNLCEFIKNKKASGKKSLVIAVAEGVMSKFEASLDKKARKDFLDSSEYKFAAERVAAEVAAKTGLETRNVILGHVQRGGAPSAYDKLLSTEIGAYGGELAFAKTYGISVCVKNNKLSYNALTDIAGKAKTVPLDHQLLSLGRSMGIYFGE